MSIPTPPKTQTLALENRPRTWDDLVGQDIPKTVLVNSLMADEIKPGYLFTGTSGCGKTSAALLFSKRLICENPNITTQDPCNSCRYCDSVDKGITTDVMYVDGASDRSVGFVRDRITPFLMGAPISGRKRIVVIDEAHLYKNDAISAFLTLLEQLPKMAGRSVVILCTTEGDAMEVPIKNRCMNLPFSPIPAEQIAEVMHGYTGAPKDILEQLAIESGCSFRSVWSMIETWQYTGQDLTEELIMKLVGGVTRAERRGLWRDLTRKNMDAVMKRWKKWVASGANPKVIGRYLTQDAIEYAAKEPDMTDWVKVFTVLSGASQLAGSSETAWLPPLYMMSGLPLEPHDAEPARPAERQPPNLSAPAPAVGPSVPQNDPVSDRVLFFGA